MGRMRGLVGATIGSALVGLGLTLLAVWTAGATHWRCAGFVGERPALPGEDVTRWVCPDGGGVAVAFFLAWGATTLAVFLVTVALHARSARARSAGGGAHRVALGDRVPAR